MFNIKKYAEINDFLKKTSNPAKIVAISKNHPLNSVLEAVNAGVYIFGENRGVVILRDYEVQDIDQYSDWKMAELKYRYMQACCRNGAEL